MKKLHLFGPVYNSSGDDCISANKVAEFLNNLDESEQFEVYINSPGGSVFEGLAIYNLLNEYQSRLTVKIVGEASSIASVIACAASKVMIADTAVMLIHNPWTFAIVDEDYIKRLDKTLSTIKSQILKIYKSKTGKSVKELSAIMAESEYHDSASCIELGLADEIYKPSEEEAKEIDRSEKIKNELVRKYMILNFKDTNISHKQSEDLMNIEQIQVQVTELQGLLSNREADLLALKSEFEALQNDYNAIQAEALELREFKAQAEADIAEKTQAIWAAEEKAFCEQLIVDKKLTRAEYMGNSQDGEVPAKVVKLLKLRNLDESLYKLEREEMSAKQSLEVLTTGFDNLAQNELSLTNFIKTKYNNGV